MNRFLAVLFLLLSSFGSYADEAYQLKNILGDWETFNNPFASYGVRISLGQSGVVSLKYCDLSQLALTGECHPVLNWDGTVTYSQQDDALLVKEGAHSPDPSYLIRVDEHRTDKFIRDWGNQKLDFFRINNG